MLGWLVENLQRNTIVQMGRNLVQDVYVTNRAAFFAETVSNEFVNGQATQVLHAINEIALSPDPKRANRATLVSWVLICSQVQVLILDPPPVDGPTGLRGCTGITGELKAYIPAL